MDTNTNEVKTSSQVEDTKINTTEPNTEPQVSAPTNTEDTMGDIVNEISGKENGEETKSPENEPQKQKDDDKSTEDNQEDFNPDDVNFDEEDDKKDKEEDKPIYKDIEGYDLEAFKDILDFENEEAMGYIKNELSELKANGFNQKQAEYYINSHLKNYREEQEEERLLNSKEHIIQDLKTNLTQEERRNYKAITNLMNELSNEGNFDRSIVKSMMSIPMGVKILNSMYKKMTNSNTVLETPVTKPKVVMTPNIAFDKYKEWIVSQPKVTIDNTKEFIEQNLKPYISTEDMDDFNEIFKSILKK